MKTYNVTIMPENITVSVPEGASLLSAAKKAGIDIESPCGGRGTCGKCAVILLSGEVSEDCYFKQGPDGYNLILSCQTKVNSDMVIEVPAFSRLTRHEVLLSNKSKAFATDMAYFENSKINPICKKIHVVLNEPDLSDSMSDFERLKLSLYKDYGIENIGISFNCIRKLPDCIRKGGWKATLTVVYYQGKWEIINIEPGQSLKPALGFAVDIGTTTVAVNLLNLQNGKIIDSVGTYNKQATYGSDVISRIIYCDETPNGLELLQDAVIDTINELIDSILKKWNIDKDDVTAMVCAGNTVMTHLFLKMTPTYIRLEPYIPGASKYPVVRAKDLGLSMNPDSPIVTLPSVASYVGGDITAGVLSTMLTRSEKLTLFIDIGTNGELVLGNSDWMVTCSCSAGPAFEGSGISCGMRAMDGAIDLIDINHDNFEVTVRTIGNKKPLGICGSGLIHSLSEMVDAGIIDRAGKIIGRANCRRIRKGNEGLEYVLCFKEESGTGSDIVITESDIKNLIRAKGAIFAGIRTMLQQVELDMDSIDRVYIAGGFGNYINITDAISIGLLPDLPPEKFKYVGNSSLQGAMIVLLSQQALDEAEDIADKMTYIELSIGNKFMDEFISALFIPHTDLGLFQRSVNEYERSCVS